MKGSGLRSGRRRAGYTLHETLLVVGIVGILAGMVYVQDEGDAVDHGALAGQKIRALIEYGQSLAVARNDQSFVLKVDPPGNRMWLALAATPDTPLTDPMTRKPCVLEMSAANQWGLSNVTIIGTNVGGNVVGFDADGGLTCAGDLEICLNAAGQECTVLTSARTCATTTVSSMTANVLDLVLGD